MMAEMFPNVYADMLDVVPWEVCGGHRFAGSRRVRCPRVL